MGIYPFGFKTGRKCFCTIDVPNQGQVQELTLEGVLGTSEGFDFSQFDYDVNMPEGVSEGELLVAFTRSTTDGSAKSLAFPAEWGVVVTEEVTGVRGLHVHAWVAGPAEPASYAITAGGGNSVETVVARISGQTVGIVDAVDGSDTGSPATCPDATATEADGIIFRFVTDREDSSGIFTAPAEVTEQYATSLMFLGTDNVYVGPGATGTSDITIGGLLNGTHVSTIVVS